jgi:hypothetical protein
MRNRPLLGFISPNSVPGVPATCHPKGWLRWRNSILARLPVLPVMGWQVASSDISASYGRAGESYLLPIWTCHHPRQVKGTGETRITGKSAQIRGHGLGVFGERV